jgi:thioredoxin-related protein
MKFLVNLSLVFFITFQFSCGNGAELTEVTPPADETVDGGVKDDSPSQVTFTTISGANPAPENPTQESTERVSGNNESIVWLDFETAIDRNKDQKKFIFIDMYTDWCSWCKKMDASTFKEPSVIDFISEHFYAVKMNPESKEAIAYKEVLYESKQYNGKSYNELAVNLLGGKMSFPSFVVLNQREVKRGVVEGFQTEMQLINALKRYID